MTLNERINILGAAFQILSSMAVSGDNVDLMHEAKVRIATVHKDLVAEKEEMKDREVEKKDAK